MRYAKLKKNKLFLLFLIAAFSFLFMNLGNIYLWHDEASTALVGKNILKYGYPRAYDGKNFLMGSYQPEIGLVTGTENFNKDYVWVSHTWLPYYISALSMKIFGQTTFGARFLFALIGFFSLFLIFRLYNMLYKDKKIIYLALILLFSSVYFFTYSRQVRYYSLLLFFTTAFLISYINLLKRKKARDILFFSLSGALLFHSHYLPFFVTFLTLTIHFVFFTDFKKKIKELSKSYFIIAFLTLPWFLYAQPWKFGANSSIFSLSNVLTAFLFVIRSVNYHYPLLILVFLPVLLYKLKKKSKIKKDKTKNEEFFSDRLLFVFILLPILIMMISPVKIYRYIFGFAPLFFLFCSRIFYIHYKKGKKYKMIAVIMLTLLLTSNLLPVIPILFVKKVVVPPIISICENVAPENKVNRCSSYIGDSLELRQVKFPLVYYAYEVTHDYDGPNEGIVKYLNENAREEDLVWAYYSGYYIQFYTDLRVMDPPEYSVYMNETDIMPDWIIYRRKPGDFAQPLVDYAKKNNYIPIILDYPDLYYENRPEPSLHKFWTDTSAKKLIIYKKP